MDNADTNETRANAARIHEALQEKLKLKEARRAALASKPAPDLAEALRQVRDALNPGDAGNADTYADVFAIIDAALAGHERAAEFADCVGECVECGAHIPQTAGPRWDRMDICAAWAQLESDYNVGGWLRERPSNARRGESVACQLWRMNYRGTGRKLNANARAIYAAAEIRLGLVDGAGVQS